MYIVTTWNWGLYKTKFNSYEDALFYYCQECATARINMHPMPYIENENGERIEV